MTHRHGQEGGSEDVLNRAIEELRAVPPLNRAHVRNIVQAAVAARAADTDGSYVERMPEAPRRWGTRRVVAVLGLSAAAGIGGFMVRQLLPERDTPSAVDASARAPRGVTSVSGIDRDLLPVPEQFVLRYPSAKRVTLIGDFNGWGVDSTIALTRGADGVWSAIVPLVPGRHTFLYRVDDTLTVLDPSRPSARDPDFGNEASVLIVGRP